MCKIMPISFVSSSDKIYGKIMNITSERRTPKTYLTVNIILIVDVTFHSKYGDVEQEVVFDCNCF